MGKRDTLAKSLAVVGTVLVVLPLLAPLILGLTMIGSPGGYRVDFLMPFEVYFVTIAGMALLVWAAFRADAHKALVVACIAVMLGGLGLLTISAQVTGIANSPERLETWRYVVTAAFGVISLLGQVGLVVAGSLLIRDLFAHHEDAPTVHATPSV